jgi:glycosyltransferase involved in cell wall biosynthesis
MKKNWLIISHAFNMDGRAASQTITDKIPNLLRSEINIEVLSAKTGARDLTLKHIQIFPWGPSALRFDFRHFMSLRFGKGLFYRVSTGLVGALLAPFVFLEKSLIGLSSQWSWFMPATLVGIFKVIFGRVDLIYTTGGAWSAHLAGWLIKSLTNVTWIVEIHDPLVFASDQHKKNIGSYRDLAAQKWLESKIASKADLVWWFTKGAYQAACARHHEFMKSGFYVLPGVKPISDMFGQYKKRSYMSFSHFGSLSNTRSLSPFLSALDNFLKKHPERLIECSVDIYGSDLDDLSKEYLKGSHLHSLIKVHGRLEFDLNSGMSGRDQIFKKMQESDVLLLIHGDTDWCSEYIPSKVYEYFYAHRPILAINHLNPELDEMVLARGGYVAQVTNQTSIDCALEVAYQEWSTEKEFQALCEPISVDSCVARILKRIQDVE